MFLSASTGLHELRIIIVDDEDDWRDTLGSILMSYGARIVSCCSVAAALSQLEQINVDILLTDIHMPQADGWSLIAAVRQSRREPLRRIPSAAMSNRDDIQLRRRVAHSGFDAFISKHSSLTSIVQSLEQLAPRR